MAAAEDKVGEIWDVVHKFTNCDGKQVWDCPFCHHASFAGWSATKAMAHVMGTLKESVVACDQTKLRIPKPTKLQLQSFIDQKAESKRKAEAISASRGARIEAQHGSVASSLGDSAQLLREHRQDPQADLRWYLLHRAAPRGERIGQCTSARLIPPLEMVSSAQS